MLTLLIYMQMSNQSVKKIAVTGAAGRIGYELLFLLAQGRLLGSSQKISLHLLGKEDSLNKCHATQMELEDCLYPCLQSIDVTADPYKAFADADYVFFAGAKTSSDQAFAYNIRMINWAALAEQGKALNQVASRNVLVSMIANPANTNTLVLLKNAPYLPAKNFHALVQLDQQRTQQWVANKTHSELKDLQQVIVWGNHSQTIVPDISHATIKPNFHITEDFYSFVQMRGQEVTTGRNGSPSCASAAHAAIESMRLIIQPPKQGAFFCSGVHTAGNPFGFDEDLIFSMPCNSFGNGNYSIAKHLMPPKAIMDRIRLSERELIEERDAAFALTTG